ncbi:hypothetical protein N6L26_06650 [Qipengyuania sp. SS22]|uniref:hypothetical protein n=1 Tax=Qipengyuania sp. SS22 TaxID=2979461 RepID=UPI0021E5EDE0|nr:hypothetical protein [Qipengyuania sp. SS22]UYH53759.1 hypothetical protein N6L26_06650 [Qipengyuania sp. SS22]
MFLPFLAAAVSFATPSFEVRDAKHVNDNLPGWVDRERKWTAARLEVFADPKGKVLSCEVRHSVPHEDVAEEMCAVLIGHRIEPARNFAGKRGYGLGRIITIVDADGRSGLASRLGRIQQDGIILTVNRLPEDAEGAPQSGIELGLEIGMQGEMVRCEALTELPDAFGEVACEQAGAQEFQIRTDADGNAVSYLRRFDINFELANQ